MSRTFPLSAIEHKKLSCDFLPQCHTHQLNEILQQAKHSRFVGGIQHGSPPNRKKYPSALQETFVCTTIPSTSLNKPLLPSPTACMWNVHRLPSSEHNLRSKLILPSVNPNWAMKSLTSSLLSWPPQRAVFRFLFSVELHQSPLSAFNLC